MADTPKEIPIPNQRVKAVRQALKLSQQDFSASISIKQGSLSDIERGRLSVSSKIADTIEKVYNIPAEWILNTSKNYSHDIVNRLEKDIERIKKHKLIERIAPGLSSELRNREENPNWETAAHIQLEITTKNKAAFQKAIPELAEFQKSIRQILLFINSYDKYLFRNIHIELYEELNKHNSTKEKVLMAHQEKLDALKDVTTIISKMNDGLKKAIIELRPFDADDVLAQDFYQSYREALVNQEFEKLSSYKDIYNIMKNYPNL
jgi:transcriptional regulator with XRE-family HTH domain